MRVYSTVFVVEISFISSDRRESASATLDIGVSGIV